MALKGKKKSGPIQQLNYLGGSYLEATSRPLYALVFLAPLVVVYELGTLAVNTDQIAHTQSRVAAFTWLMAVAEWAGVNRTWACMFPGVVVAIILLCWHISARHPWKVKWKWLGWMAVECVILTVPLFLVGALMNTSSHFSAGVTCAANGVRMTAESCAAAGGAGHGSPYAANLVISIGAGIYEELMFRMVVMGLLVMLFEDVIKLKAPTAIIISVLVSSLLFAAHHYIGIEGGHIVRLQAESFTPGGFLFRSLAGIYFAAVFWYFGYGVSAGTHAAYNMIYFALKPMWG